MRGIRVVPLRGFCYALAREPHVGKQERSAEGVLPASVAGTEREWVPAGAAVTEESREGRVRR